MSYDGKPFNGWQIQPDRPSVQETLEQALEMLLHTHVKVTGAGRTDTGVNARCMGAHFDTAEGIADVKRLVCSLNSIVGRDIAVYSVVRVAADKLCPTETMRCQAPTCLPFHKLQQAAHRC